MRIAHYNTFSEGGAAVLMRRLNQSLLAMGHDSRIRYRTGNLLIPGAHRIEYSNGVANRQLERFCRRAENLLLRNEVPSHYGRLLLHKATPPLIEDLEAQIIHLHWVNQWLDLPSFLEGIPKHVPLVWTIHDMSPLAGGCFTDFGCDQLTGGCHRCPLLKAPFDRILPRNELQRRKKALEGRPLYAVGNSRFTTSLVEQSPLFKSARISTIHPALNGAEYILHDKTEAKRLLGIAPDRFVLGFGAASLTDENKGFSRFLQVVEKVAERMDGLDALVFGDGIAAVSSSKVKVHTLGPISSPLLQSLVYSAMDVFVVTSKMETFGQVATEAQACGTPVWAFDVGGLSDAIHHGNTGKLIPFAEITTMADSISSERAQGNLSAMGSRGAAWVRKHFCLEKMAEQYLNLYREALVSKENIIT
jgi:glycosyltransferase involved in cell wall biosynthesis